MPETKDQKKVSDVYADYMSGSVEIADKPSPADAGANGAQVYDSQSSKQKPANQ